MTHGKNCRCLTTAAAPGVLQKLSALARQMRRAIAHEQTFTETRERLHIVPAHAGDEPIDGFGVPSSCIALFSAHDFR